MKKLLFFLLFCIILWSCGQDKFIPNGYDALNRKNKGELVTQTLKAVDSAELWKTPSTGYNEYFLLGQRQNTLVHTIMRFYPTVYLDSAKVESAQFFLNQSNAFGQGDRFKVTIYPVLSADWSETSVIWKDIEPIFDVTDPIASFMVSSSDTASISLPFPADVVNEWILRENLDANIKNNGILLKVSNADFVAQFSSSDLQVNEPYLRLIHKTENDDSDTTDVTVTEDATLYEYNSVVEENSVIPDQESIHIDNLQGFRILVKFDFSSIPQQASIHQAILSLDVDQEKSYTGVEGIGLQAEVVLLDTTVQDPTWYNSDIAIDSTLQYLPTSIGVSDVDLDFSDQTSIQYMSRIVQNWLLDVNPNHGLLVRSTEHGYNPYQLYFHTGKNDSTRRMEMIITYSLPPATKF